LRRILSEIGASMDVFPNEHHLASWVGMYPWNNESADKKSSWIGYGDYFTNADPPLTGGAGMGRNPNKGTYFRTKYESMVGRMGKKGITSHSS